MEPQKTPREQVKDLIRLLVPDWRPTTRQGLWAIRIGIVLGLLYAIGYFYGVSLWDWIKLLIVPAAIAGAGFWFTQQQRVRELQIADERAQTDQEIASQRRQDDTLQAYLDGMSQLLTDKDLPLHRAQPGDSLSTVARARTLTVLGRLDRDRKRSVLQFLYESDLICNERTLLNESDLMERRHNIVSLEQANLRHAHLSRAHLSDADLSDADLHRADLSYAHLDGANLSDAVLTGANLRRANVSDADLSDADLSDADLSSAQGWTEDQLSEALTLKGATMPNGQKYEEWLKDRQKR